MPPFLSAHLPLPDSSGTQRKPGPLVSSEEGKAMGPGMLSPESSTRSCLTYKSAKKKEEGGKKKNLQSVDVTANERATRSFPGAT